MFYALLFNILLFCLYIYLTFDNNWYARSTLFLFITFYTIWIYYLLAAVGLDYFNINYFSLAIPYWLVIPFSLVVLLLSAKSQLMKSYRLVLIYLAAIASSVLIYVQDYDSIAKLANFDKEAIIQCSMLLFSFTACVYFPLITLADNKTSLLQRLFAIRWSHVYRYRIAFILCITCILVSSFIIPPILMGSFLGWKPITTISSLVLSGISVIFYKILILHVVGIGLPKHIIDSLFSDDETSMGEIVIYAALFAGLQFVYPFAMIILFFVYGLLFSYLFLKTKSLSYGILLHGLIVIFVE